jgi:hypothetical protein
LSYSKRRICGKPVEGKVIIVLWFVLVT